MKKGLCSSIVRFALVSGFAMAMGGGAWAQDCKPREADLGDGQTLKIGCDPLKIAFLSPGTNNEYLQAAIRGVRDAAQEEGVEVEIFDAGWNASTQTNQAENVITSGRFNAIIAEAVDGNQACKVFSENAPEAGILVSVKNQPLCGRTTAQGDELWAPGTLNYVGGTQSVASFSDWLDRIAKENPGPQKVAVLTGPDLNANTITMDAAIATVKKAHPEFDIIATVRTDYTVADGNQKMSSLLQANPDMTIAVIAYSDPTRGAVQAIKQAGLLDKIRVYDNGGNKWAFTAVKMGDVTSTRTLTPYTEGFKAVKSLVAAWKGEDTPRYIPLDSSFVDESNISENKPEF